MFVSPQKSSLPTLTFSELQTPQANSDLKSVMTPPAPEDPSFDQTLHKAQLAVKWSHFRHTKLSTKLFQSLKYSSIIEQKRYFFRLLRKAT
jgi:hypothetical protein